MSIVQLRLFIDDTLFRWSTIFSVRALLLRDCFLCKREFNSAVLPVNIAHLLLKEAVVVVHFPKLLS